MATTQAPATSTTLAQRLLRIPAFARIADSRSAVLRSLRPPRRIVSINELLRMAPWVNGVKTGHTFGAGFVLVGSGRRKGVELISAAIGAPTDEDRFTDNLKLLDYGFSAIPGPYGGSQRPGPRRLRRSATSGASCRWSPGARSRSRSAAASG